MTTEPVASEASQGDLLAAVKQLTDEVRALREMLKTEYPKREEVQREGRERAIRYLALSVVILLVAQLMTISTISYCFLPDKGYPRACRAIPGYGAAVDRGDQQLKVFTEITRQTTENRKKIDELEREIQKLKNNGK